MKQEIDRWVTAVTSGQILVGRHLRLAVDRYLIDLDRVGDESFPFVFNEKLATAACEFFPTFCSHTKGEWAGQPFHLSPLQKFITWQLMGWRHKDSGLRRVSRLFVCVARKWGKSTYAAGLALLLMLCDVPFEPDAELYVAATKEQQACIVHLAAVKMVLQNESLKKRLKLYRKGQYYSAILAGDAPFNGSVFRPIGSDSKSTDGLNPHVVIMDELHEWKRHHKGLKEKLETASGSRRQPVTVTISTNGDDQSKFFNDDLAACESMLEQIGQGNHDFDDSLLAIVCKLDEARPCSCEDGCEDCDHTGTLAGDDPFDEANWVKANPDVYHTTPKIEYLRKAAKRAENQPSLVSAWLRYHCNMRVSSKIKLIDDTAWARCSRDNIDWQAADALCLGVDLGHRDDFSGVALAGRFNDPAGGCWYGLSVKHFCCERNDLRNLAEPPYSNWVTDGWLDVTEGDTTDFERIKQAILDLKDETGVGQLRFDPANARQLGTEMANSHGMLAVEFYQNHNRYNEPLREFLKQIKDGQLINLGDPCLAFQAGNLIGAENTKAQMMPDKSKSADKIDGIVASVMAFSGVMAGMDVMQKPASSFYESNTLEVMGW